MSRPSRLSPVAGALLIVLSTVASAGDEEAIRRAVGDFLTRQAKSLPGPAQHDIGRIDASALAPGCKAIAVSAQPGSRAWGRSHVQARCTAGASWSLYVPVEVHVTADYVVSARAVRAGQTLAAADVSTRRGDLAELPVSVLTDPAQAIGQTAAADLPAERPLRADQLRKPVVVRQGQNVRVISSGAGFEVASEGKATGNALAGQVVQVRMPTGQIISGVAQTDGSVRLAQ